MSGDSLSPEANNNANRITPSPQEGGAGPVARVPTEELPNRRLQFVPDFKTASADLIHNLGKATAADIETLMRQLEAELVNRARQPAIEDCLKKAGVYVWHVACLTVKFADRPHVASTMYEEWCVVKVGMAKDQTLNFRLNQELTDTTQWRVKPGLHITAKGLKDGREGEAIYVGDLVACLHGPAWSGSEKKIKRRLGLPLGTSTGKGHGDRNLSATNQMTDEHPKINKDYWNGQGTIQAETWNRYFKKGRGASGKKNVAKSQLGPSELIMMRKKDMLRLREAFKSNPAHFASTFPGDDSVPANIVDGETGPAWKLINKISEKLPPVWYETPVVVQFEDGVKKDDLIDPLTLNLWDPEEAKKQKQNSPNKAPMKQCDKCGLENPCAQKTCKAKGCGSRSFITNTKGSAKKKVG